MKEQERVTAAQRHYHDHLMETALSFLVSQSLYTAVQLKVFTHLSGNKSLSLPEISEAVEAPPFRLEKLLDTCIGIGVLQRNGERYANTPMAEECLVEGKTGYYGHMIHYVSSLFFERGWQMTEVVQKGQPANVYESIRRNDDEISHMSTMAMEDMSSKVGRMLAEALDISGARRLLDVGGGSGVVARVLAEQTPGLEAVILDQPLVLKIAQELCASSPAASQIGTHVADYNEDEFPKGFDVLILSNIIHINGFNACQKLMHKAYKALNPGGQAVVIDFYLDDGKQGPLFANIFGIACSLLSPKGATYSWEETEGWLREAGFDEVKRMALTEITGCVVGRKAR